MSDLLGTDYVPLAVPSVPPLTAYYTADAGGQVTASDVVEVTIAPPSLVDPTAAKKVSPAERERAQAALCIVDGNHLLSKMAELLLGNRESDGVSKRGGIASGLRRLAARLEHIGQEGGFEHRELPPTEIAKLEWLPQRFSGDREFGTGWNACIDTIRKHREPVKPKTV